MSLSIFRFPALAQRLWVLGQMGVARLDFMRMKDVRFWKLCGSGSGEGFTPKPNTAVWAILATWPDADTAREKVGTAAVYQRWRHHAAEDWTVFLSTASARGKWAGQQPFAPSGDTPDGPLAALTRATIRPQKLLKFWGRESDISCAIAQDPNVIFKIGIGEVPWLHQVTFSIWPNARAMANFARHDGPHARAIRAVRDGGWFREELYARFALLGDYGTWGGESPLKDLKRPVL